MKAVWALFSLNGRMRRRDFWLGGLAVNLICLGIVVGASLTLPLVLPVSAGHGRLIGLLPTLPFYSWITVALWTKRFHDRDISMWELPRVLFPLRGQIWGAYECC